MTKHEIDCEQALDQLIEFVDHELPEGKHSAMQHHMRACKSCFSRFEFERRLKEKLGTLRDTEVSSDASERIKRLLKSF
ncbi:MAG: zf-HC2 domain-containing protein [Burkholderiales bacterium]|nr:zf-HC2 domain-containing protein [Burkholderiales bacterium]